MLNFAPVTIENFENIISYRATFYTIIDGKETPIHVDAMNNTANIKFLEIDLGAIEDTNLNVIKPFEKIEEMSEDGFITSSKTERAETEE